MIIQEIKMGRLIKPIIATLITIFILSLAAYFLANYPQHFLTIFVSVFIISAIFGFWKSVFDDMDEQ